MIRIFLLTCCISIPISLPHVVGQESDTTTSKGTLDARRPKLRLEDSKSDVKAATPKKESKDKLEEAWIGKLDMGVIKPVMQFRIVTLKSGKTTAFFDSITEGRTGFEATWSVDGDMLKFDVAKIKLRFRGILNKTRDTAEGTWSQGGRKLSLTLKKQATEYDKATHVWPEQTEGTLSNAVTVGDLDRVKLLIENGADPIAMDRNGVTPFQLATISGYGKIADYLVAKGASRSQPIPSGDELTDRLLQRIVKKHSPGVAVLVSRDGKVLFKKSYGLADREQGLQVQPDTKFRIGSVTKQFTAAAILKLQEQGKLSVNDKLSKHLPDFPRGDDVTLRHLLTHTSGIPSHTSKPDFMRKVVSPVKPEEVIDTFKNDRFDFEPGVKQIYRNSNYFLLGHIASKVSGKSLDAFLQSEFFKPLGMKSTGVYRNDAPPDGEALGYSYEGGGLKRALDWDMSWAGGAGALYSTLGDLNRWNEALFAGKVLNQSTLESAFARAKTSDGKETNYGYGWKIAQHRGLKVIGHGGGLHGFMSRLYRYPDAKLTVVVCANAVPPPPDLVPGPLVKTIGEFFLWREMDPRETFEMDTSVTEDDLKDFVGRYDFGKGVITVTRKGKQLFVQPTGQRAREIFPKSKDEFFPKDIEARMKFVRDEKGKVVQMILYQNGREMKAPKLPEKVRLP